MKKYILLIITLLLFSITAYASSRSAYIKLPAGTPLSDIKVVSLIGNGNNIRYEASNNELDISMSKDNSRDTVSTLKLTYTPSSNDRKLKFAIIYKVDEKNFVTLLSPDTDPSILDEMKKSYDSDNPTEILDEYLSNWNDFPGIVLEKDMNLFAIPIDDNSSNILLKLIDEGTYYEGQTGGINPGGGGNTFVLKSNGSVVVDIDYLKSNKKNLDSNNTLGYFHGDFINFKPHKHDTNDRIVIINSDGTQEELPNSPIQLTLEKDSKVRIWNSKKNGNGTWYFTIINGKIIDQNDSTKVTLVEDIWTSASESVSMSSGSNSTRNRISNIKINNNGDGSLNFDIISIKE